MDDERSAFYSLHVSFRWLLAVSRVSEYRIWSATRGLWSMCVYHLKTSAVYRLSSIISIFNERENWRFWDCMLKFSGQHLTVDDIQLILRLYGIELIGWPTGQTRRACGMNRSTEPGNVAGISEGRSSRVAGWFVCCRETNRFGQVSVEVITKICTPVSVGDLLFEFVLTVPYWRPRKTPQAIGLTS